MLKITRNVIQKLTFHCFIQSHCVSIFTPKTCYTCKSCHSLRIQDVNMGALTGRCKIRLCGRNFGRKHFHAFTYLKFIQTLSAFIYISAGYLTGGGRDGAGHFFYYCVCFCTVEIQGIFETVVKEFLRRSSSCMIDLK